MFAFIAAAVSYYPQSSAAHTTVCNHTHPVAGSYSLCKVPRSGTQSCKVGSNAGHCQLTATGCRCISGKASVIEQAVDDMRTAFDVIEASLPLVDAVRCPQVQAMSGLIDEAVPALTDYGQEPVFAGIEILVKIDSLLTGLPLVQAAAAQCLVPLAPNLEAVILDFKSGVLSTLD